MGFELLPASSPQAPAPSNRCNPRRGVREVEGDRLEICCTARYRGFESHPLRQIKQWLSRKWLSHLFWVNLLGLPFAFECVVLLYGLPFPTPGLPHVNWVKWIPYAKKKLPMSRLVFSALICPDNKDVYLHGEFEYTREVGQNFLQIRGYKNHSYWAERDSKSC